MSIEFDVFRGDPRYLVFPHGFFRREYGPAASEWGVVVRAIAEPYGRRPLGPALPARPPPGCPLRKARPGMWEPPDIRHPPHAVVLAEILVPNVSPRTAGPHPRPGPAAIGSTGIDAAALAGTRGAIDARSRSVTLPETTGDQADGGRSTFRGSSGRMLRNPCAARRSPAGARRSNWRGCSIRSTTCSRPCPARSSR